MDYLLRKTGDLLPPAQVQVYDQVLRHAYWQQKDLPGAIRIGKAGIALGKELSATYPEQNDEINSQVKSIHYNLASFTWPGWDEPGFTITPDQIQLGLASAQANLRLAIELKKPPLPLSRAYWMLAAQEIAINDYPSAKQHFSLAEEFASQAGSQAEALLSRGFSLLTDLIADPGNPDAEQHLDAVRSALLAEEQGEFFVQQIDNGLRIFG